MAFTWSKSRRAYINDITGKTVSADQLVRWASQASDGSKARIQKLAEQLNNGEISEREFQIAMHSEITSGHSALWALAFGGLLAMSATRWAAVRPIIGRQLMYFRKFTFERNTGQVSPAQIVNRSGMYAAAEYSTYMNGTVAREREFSRIARMTHMERQVVARIAALAGEEARAAAAPTVPQGATLLEAVRAARAARVASEAERLALARMPGGARFARRILDSEAQHCTDCIDLANDKNGNPIDYPIDEVPPIGASQCQSMCRCTIEFIDGTTQAAA